MHAKHIFLKQQMVKISEIFAEAKLEKTRQLKAVYLTLRIRQMWKRRKNRWGHGLDNEFKKKTKLCLLDVQRDAHGIHGKNKVTFRDFMID